MRKLNFNNIIRGVILCLIIFYTTISYTQSNRVDKIIENIQQNEFEKAIKLSNKLNDKTPLILKNYVFHLIYNDPNYSNKNIDSAYNFLIYSSIDYELLEEGIQYEYCSRFNLCDNYITNNRQKLENEAFLLYSKDSSVVNLAYFILHYENPLLQQKAKDLIEKIEFNNAIKTNTVNFYNEFLLIYPNSLFKNEVIYHIELIEYNEVIKINTISGYKEFLYLHPFSLFKKEVNEHWEDLEFNNCITKNDAESYRAFLITFKFGKNQNQAKVNLGKIIYEKVINSEHIKDYNDFLNEFSYKSTYGLKTEIDSIQNKLCYLTYKQIKNSLSLDTLERFLLDFEGCLYKDSIKAKIQILEFKIFNDLLNVFSIIAANDYLKQYPNSPFKKQVLSKLFEMEYPIIEFEEDYTKIEDFRKKYLEINAKINFPVNSYPKMFYEERSWPKKYGFIDQTDSNIVIYPMYEDARDFSNGLAAVKFGNLWGFIDKRGNIIIDLIYEEVRDFHEGLAGVKSDGLWIIIDKSNSPISSQKYQNVGIYNSGLINVSTLTSGWVFISNEGKIQSKGMSYISASSFASGYAFVQEGSRYFIVDNEFKKIFEVDYNSHLYNNYTILDACSGFEASPERNVLCNYYERRNPYSIKKYGDALLLNEGLVYDLKKKECWLSEYVFFDNQILVFGNRRTGRSQKAALNLYSNYGNVQSANIKQAEYGNGRFIEILRVKNNIVLRYSENEIKNIRIEAFPDVKLEKYNVIQQNGRYHFEDKNKEVLGNKMDYTYASEFLEGIAIVGVSNKYVLIDTNANQFGEVCDRITRINSRLFVVCFDGKCFLMDINGNYLSKGYNSIDSRVYNGALIVTTGNLKGFIDMNGKEIIKPQYIDAKGFSNGKAIVTAIYGSKTCYSWDCKGVRIIDKKGNKIYGDYKTTLYYNPYMVPIE